MATVCPNLGSGRIVVVTIITIFVLVNAAAEQGGASDRGGDGEAETCTSTAPTIGEASHTETMPTATAPTTKDEYPRFPSVKRKRGARVWSVEEVAVHNGSDIRVPLLLAILGEVYDVGTGKEHYAPGGGYSSLAGRDAGRAFGSGIFEGDGLSATLDGLEDGQVNDVIQWRSFYRKHETYRFVGFLDGPYFDNTGASSEEHARIQKIRKTQQNLASLEGDFRKRFMTCNTKFVHKNPMTEIWCDDSYHRPGSVPVHVYFRLPGSRQSEQSMCACVPLAERKAVDEEAAELASRPQLSKITFMLADYPECRKDAQRCDRPKGASPPSRRP
eukprot:TRINITY_DN51595_c0_g1_i1.p1 TRINITY_DN51595_c0_g1~~TRINITY_DN51595_c0_g1_i1.p1  ORF type:complete len:346 (-),score=61.45 TRINITY_DN51595_c0_g1_i1:204-1193(-)